MPTAIVVGSGAGGATVAKALQGAFDVLILEAGREFRPFKMQLAIPEGLKRLGLLFSEREIELLFATMRILKTKQGMVLVRGIGTGGTTTLATANALRMDRDLRAIGIDLDQEFAELHQELPISIQHQDRWRESTRRLFLLCEEMGLEPRPTPKLGRFDLCRNCGHCVLGCLSGAKWDSRGFLQEAVQHGARLVTRCRVLCVRRAAGRATGVEASVGGRRHFYPADVIVLAAGGLGTPVLLQNSGIPCEETLFVDPVLCVAAEWKGARQNSELPMPFIVQQDRYIVSPYFDLLSYYFNRNWRPLAANTISLMIKLADASVGTIAGGNIRKVLTKDDEERLRTAVELCRQLLGRLGIGQGDTFLGTLNAGHPGGMLGLTHKEATSLHPERLPDNVYVADATLLPASLGNPPMLTIMALARRIARAITVKWLNTVR
ncbi:GMC family oxidoreductase N-terminal domain-containing protein [Myxococcota bacterium]